MIRFAGTHIIIYINSYIEKFLQIVQYRILTVMEEYNLNISEINHIILTLIPVNYNLLTRSRLDKSTDKTKIDNFIKNNFSSIVIPISVNPKFLGKELFTKVIDGKFSNIIFYHSTEYKVKNLSSQLSIDTNLNSLPLSFKFYKVIINNIQYILGILYGIKKDLKDFVSLGVSLIIVIYILSDIYSIGYILYGDYVIFTK